MSLSHSSRLLRQPAGFYGQLALLALLPLPFGTARPWASDAFGLWVSVLLLALLWDLRRTPGPWPAGAPWKRLAVSAALMGLVAFWCLVQTWNIPSLAHPLWSEAATALNRPVSASISITPGKMPESLLRLLAYGGCFLLAFFWGRDGEKAGLILKVFTASAALYALYALVMQSTGLRMILWYDKWAYRDFATATFVNKNSFAAYAGLGLQACLALLWRQIKRSSAPPPKDKRPHLLTWLVERRPGDWVLALMALTVLGGLWLSGSRGGMASSLAGCLVFFAALAVNRRMGWKAWAVGAIVTAALLGGLLMLNPTVFTDRLGTTQVENDGALRTGAYAQIIDSINSAPWTGFGLGSFDSAFRLYRTPAIKLWFEHAHNDYLEAMLELGLPAAFALLAAVLIPISCCVQGIWQRRRQEVFPALALGVSATIGLHGLIDFDLQIPALAASYATLLGLGVAQSWSSRSSAD